MSVVGSPGSPVVLMTGVVLDAMQSLGAMRSLSPARCRCARWCPAGCVASMVQYTTFTMG